MVGWSVLPGTDFVAHTDAWQSLNAARGNSPLLDPEVLRACLAAFGSGRERLAILGDPTTPQAMGFLVPTGKGSWQSWQPANAPLGFWLARPDCDLAGISRALLFRLPGLPLLLGISQQDPLLVPRPVESAFLSTLDYIVTARIALAGMSYQDYWRQRSKNLRHDIKRQSNRLAREQVRTRLEAVTEAAAMVGAVRDYALLETRGWKEAINSAVIPGGLQAHFYETLLQALAVRGEAAVYRFFYDDQLVATDLCLRRSGCLIILKTTYDETCQGTSPAHLMRHAVIQDALETGRYHTIEFYGPVQDWHRRWSEDLRTLYHVNVVRGPFLSSLRRWKG